MSGQRGAYWDEAEGAAVADRQHERSRMLSQQPAVSRERCREHIESMRAGVEGGGDIESTRAQIIMETKAEDKEWHALDNNAQRDAMAAAMSFDEHGETTACRKERKGPREMRESHHKRCNANDGPKRSEISTRRREG